MILLDFGPFMLCDHEHNYTHIHIILPLQLKSAERNLDDANFEIFGSPTTFKTSLLYVEGLL